MKSGKSNLLEWQADQKMNNINHQTPNKASMLIRREEAITLLMEGMSRDKVKDVLIEKFGVHFNTAYGDIVYAQKRIKKRFQMRIPQVIDKHTDKYYKIYKQAIELGDLKSAIASLQAIEKLLKVNEDKPLVAIQNNNFKLDNITLDDLKELLNDEDKTN